MCLFYDPPISLLGTNSRAAVLKIFGLRPPFTLLKLTEDPNESFCLYGLYLLVVTILGIEVEKTFTHENTQALILSGVRAMTSSHAV